MPQIEFLTRDYASPPHHCVIGLTLGVYELQAAA